MALTIREVPTETLDQAKLLTGERTASKAVVAAAVYGIEMHAKMQMQAREIDSLRQKLEVMAQTVERLASAAESIQVLARQQDNGL